MGVAYGGTATDLLIAGKRVDVVQHSATVGLRKTLDSRWSLGGSLGVLAAGELLVEGRRHTYRPGGAASFSAGRPIAPDLLGKMFVATNYSFAATYARTRSPFGRTGSYLAIDISAGIALGRTVWNVWSPYMSARVFGGPVWFTGADGAVPGQDPDHHSMGLGSVFTLPKNFEVGIDAALVGARGLTAQAGVNF